MEKFLFWLLVSIIGLVIAALGFGVYAIWYQSKQPTFSLYKNQWECVQTRVYYTQTSTVVGKTVVPQTQRNVECINYVRK